MGLFHRPTVATPSSGHSFVDVIQNEGNNTSRGLIAWRHPSTDFNTHSKLIVRKGEEAIFEDGASEWAIFPGGTECELHTQNIAVIRKFREFLSGGHSYFPCRVYFISTEEYEIPWGTVEPVGYTCPLLGEGAAEYEEKIKKGKLERGRRNSKTYEAYAKKQQLYTDIFNDAPDIKLDEAKAKYGMSNTAYYSYKEKAGIELKKDINQKKIDELFTNNPNIGYEEFHAETGLSRASFTIYRNKYGFNDADREKKQKWEQVFEENPDITFSEAKKYGISNTSYYRYRKKYSKT